MGIRGALNLLVHVAVALLLNWPVAADGTRAIALGLPSPPPLKEIVAQYLEDFGK